MAAISHLAATDETGGIPNPSLPRLAVLYTASPQGVSRLSNSVIIKRHLLGDIYSSYCAVAGITSSRLHDGQQEGTDMQLVPGTSVPEHLSALYVGSQCGRQWWTARWLPGRRLSTDEALTATLIAETLSRTTSIEAGQWAELEASAELLGLSVRDLAGFLGIQCDVPDLPPAPELSRRQARWWPQGRR